MGTDLGHLARQEVKRTTPPRAVGREGEWF